MSDPLICPHPDCDRPVPDGLICAYHTDRLRRDLEQMPVRLGWLADAVTRQTAFGGGGARDRTPLPFSPAASEVSWDARNTLLAWVRTFELGDLPTKDDPAAWARWLLARIERIRGHLEGGQCADEIAHLSGRILRVVNPPPEMVYCGVCEVCGRGGVQSDLYAQPGENAATCRLCKTVVDVEPRRKQLRELAEDMLVTRNEALRACPQMAGAEIPRQTLDSWIKRGSVPDRGGRVRLGDVLDAAAGWVARKRA